MELGTPGKGVRIAVSGRTFAGHRAKADQECTVSAWGLRPKRGVAILAAASGSLADIDPVGCTVATLRIAVRTGCLPIIPLLGQRWPKSGPRNHYFRPPRRADSLTEHLRSLRVSTSARRAHRTDTMAKSKGPLAIFCGVFVCHSGAIFAPWDRNDACV